MKKLLYLYATLLAFPCGSFAGQPQDPSREQIHLILDSVSTRSFEKKHDGICNPGIGNELRIVCDLALFLHTGNAEFFLRGGDKQTIQILSRLDKIYHVEKDKPMVDEIRKAGGIDLFYLARLYGLAWKNHEIAVTKFFKLGPETDGYLAEYFDELTLDFFKKHPDLVLKHWPQIKNTVSTDVFLTTNFDLTDKKKLVKRSVALCQKKISSHCAEVIRFVSELKIE